MVKSDDAPVEWKRNAVYSQLFTQARKAQLFDEIAAHYYDANFGTNTKSELDLQMFSLYLDGLIDKGFDFDDYTVSKQLGILQSTVRQLKKKKQLIYPRAYEWEKAFLDYAAHVLWDTGDKVAVSIPDPNVSIELQHYLETRLHGYVDWQLNPRVLKISIGYFIQLMLLLNGIPEKKQKAFEKELLKQLNAQYNSDLALMEKVQRLPWQKRLTRQAFPFALDALKNCLPGGTVWECLTNLG